MDPRELNQLPYDLQELILKKHAKNYLSRSRYAVEMIISANVLPMGMWEEDGFCNYVIPIVQVIYDARTGKWYKPGRRVIPTVSYTPADGLNISFQSKTVGESEIDSHTVQCLLRRTINSPKYKDICHVLHNTNPWECWCSTFIRVRRMVSSPPSGSRDTWTNACPSSHNNRNTYNPYMPYYTMHRRIIMLSDQDDAMYKWGVLRKTLERDGSPDKIPELWY